MKRTSLLFVIFLLIPSFSYAQKWQQTNGPWGGDVNTFAQAPNGYVYMGTKYGLYRSIDNGSTWATNISEYKDIRSIAIKSSGEIFASSMEYNNSTLYQSTDNGETWSSQNIPYLNCVGITNTGDILCGLWGKDVMIRSSDNGKTWQKSNYGLPSIYTTKIFVEENGNIFLGADGIYKSTDNGYTWGKKSLEYNDYVRSIIKDNEGNLWICQGYKGIFSSSDDGEKWNKHVTRLDSSIAMNSLCMNALGEILAANVNNGIYKYNSKDTTWYLSNYGFDYGSQISLYTLADGTILAGASISGIFCSNDNGNYWLRTKFLYPIIRALVVSDDNEILVGTNNGLYYSKNNGAIWKQATSSPDIFTISLNNNGDIFLGGPVNDFILYKDKINYKLIDMYITVSSVFGKNDIIYIASYQLGFGFSTNYGDTWTTLTSGMITYNSSYITINRNEVFFAGTKFSGIYRMRKGENYWTHIITGLDYYSISSIMFNKNDDIFVSTFGGGIYYSNDEGETWLPKSKGLGNLNIQCLAIDSSNNIYAGTIGNGIYYSSDNGESWIQINNGLTCPNVYSLAAKPSGGILAGTDKGGVFILNETMDIKDNNNYDNSLKIFPNPSSGKISINFKNLLGNSVRVSILDSYGNKIYSNNINDEHQIILDGSNLSSGVYYCIAQDKNVIKTEKFVIIK